MMTDILFQVIPQSNKIDLLQKKFQRLQRGLMEYLKNQTDAVLHSFWFQRLFNASLGFFSINEFAKRSKSDVADQD